MHVIYSAGSFDKKERTVYMKNNPAGIRIHRILFFCALFICIAVLTVSFAEKTGKVHGGWLILRSLPSYSGKQLASYPSGTVVIITGQSGSWYEVKTPDGLKGFMLGTYLYISGDDLTEGGDAWVTSANGLNVRLRSGAGTKYGAIASYPPGTKCTVQKKMGDWCQVKIGSSKGYMMTKFLTATNPGGSGGGTVLYDVYVTSANGKGVKLRSAAYKGNNVIGFYEVGTKGGMITKGSVWSYIQIDGKTGYMMSEFLTTTVPGPVIPTGTSIVFSYNGKSVNLRSGPGKQYQILRSYSPGTPLIILSAGSEWDFVNIGGKYGYMMNQFIYTK